MRARVALTHLLTAGALSAGTPAAARDDRPAVIIVTPIDAATIKDYFTFGPPQDALKRYGTSNVTWAVEVRLPKGVSLRADATDLADPALVRLSDGQCYRLSIDAFARSYGVASTPCPPRANSAAAALRAASGYTFKGRAFDRNAWTNDATGVTGIYYSYPADSPPGMTTRLRVVAVDGSGPPDAPVTLIRMQALDGHRVLICGIALVG